jgi:hypothetical protein
MQVTIAKAILLIVPTLPFIAVQIGVEQSRGPSLSLGCDQFNHVKCHPDWLAGRRSVE